MKITFKTLKAPLLLAATFSALSINVLAETYTVQVELNSTVGETPLVATQTQAMSYPVLEISEATQTGAACVVDTSANNIGYDGEPATSKNSLCPGERGVFARVEFSGAPNAVITLERRLPLQEINGIRFGWHGEDWKRSDTLTLTAENGTAHTLLYSSVELFDKSQATDSVMDFTYDISAAYQ